MLIFISNFLFPSFFEPLEFEAFPIYIMGTQIFPKFPTKAFLSPLEDIPKPKAN